MGGESEEKGPAYKLVEAYNVALKKWSRKADMHYARHGTQAILSGDSIFIAAGSPNRGGGYQKNMEGYIENAPRGEATTASHLSLPESLIITKGQRWRNRNRPSEGGSGERSYDSKLAFVP